MLLIFYSNLDDVCLRFRGVVPIFKIMQFKCSPNVFTAGQWDRTSDLHLPLAVKSYSQVGPGRKIGIKYVSFCMPGIVSPGQTTNFLGWGPSGPLLKNSGVPSQGLVEPNHKIHVDTFTQLVNFHCEFNLDPVSRLPCGTHRKQSNWSRRQS